jgi:Kef-type K+ transport system membrane component KefB
VILLALPGATVDLGATVYAGIGEITAVLAGLLILLVAAKIGEEVCRRVGLPGVVGEMAGGFLVGPFALGWVVPGETALAFAEIGVILLLFTVGLEVRFDDLIRVGRPALLTAVIGMILPVAAGVAVAVAMGAMPGSAAFVGLALAATSIGITSRVLRDRGVLEETFSRVVLGAAVIDDVLVLLLMGVVTGVVQGSGPGTAIVVATAAVGLVLLGFAAARRARGLPREVFTWPLFADTPLVPAFILMLAIALLSAAVGLAAIIGAFVFGLVIAETEARDELEHDMGTLGEIFVPFFFAVTGATVDIGALADPTVAIVVVILVVLGVATKLAGGLLGARSLGWNGSLAVGAGMVPRGEVGIVAASLGLAAGLLTGGLYSAVIVAVVLTTVIAPLILGWVIPRAVAESEARDGPGDRPAVRASEG